MVRWRYQPVVRGDENGFVFSLCEVYLDEDGALENWTEDPAMTPSGENIGELSSDLTRMIADALSWKPVVFEKMEVGMTFEAAVSMEDRKEIADLIDRMSGNLECRQNSVN